MLSYFLLFYAALISMQRSMLIFLCVILKQVNGYKIVFMNTAAALLLFTSWNMMTWSTLSAAVLAVYELSYL